MVPELLERPGTGTDPVQRGQTPAVSKGTDLPENP